jgi:carbon-monoxide dehydrogenase medium subunit
MYEFDYRRPHSLNEADLALKAMPGAKFLAGGQTLLPTMKQRLARPEALIDLGAIPELKAIAVTADSLVIGAMATHAAVAASPEVKSALPGLAALAEGIGDPHVRHRGTIGGSVANNDPAADYPGALLALGATVHTDKRAIAADAFFTALFTTALQENEMVTAISFPLPAKFAYAKFPNPASRYALVGVAVGRRGGETRIAVTGAGADGVFRATTLEDELKSGGITGKSVNTIGLMSDMHANADYRAHLITVMAKRAVGMIA